MYRPGIDDEHDPEVAAALALAKEDAELGAWLEAHCGCQTALRGKFRAISVPAGLKEQIISEQAAQERSGWWSGRKVLMVAAACLILLAGGLDWYSRPAPENTLANFREEMVALALRGYAMDLTTNDLAQIRTYLGKHEAPADFQVTKGLTQIKINGCAVETWQDAKVTMVCFHTPKTTQENNLWLFVVDQSSVRKVDVGSAPKLSKVNRLITATWTQDGKVYVMGAEGNENDIRDYL